MPKEEKPEVAWIRDQWQKADRALLDERRSYWLNLAFFEDEQWVWWHKGRQEVVEFPRPRADDRMRLTDNRMQPNLVTLLAKLQKRDLAFDVPASESDDSAIGGARLGEHLLAVEHGDRDWEAIRAEEMHAAFLGGTSAVVVEWDPNYGAKIGDLEDAEVREGGVQLTPLAITEFSLEPGSRSIESARWFIMAKALPPKQVKDLFGLKTEPSPDAQMGHGPMQRRLWAERGYHANVDLTVVYSVYHRPTRDKPKGRYLCVADGEVLHDRPWPFSFAELNITTFRQIPLPKRWTGWTSLNAARPLQVAYNHGLSMLSEHMKLAGNARLTIPDSAGIDTDDWTDEPGEIIRYDGMSSKGPEWLSPPNLPRWLVEHVARLRSAIDDVMNVHDISRGVAPGDRNSGLALSVLAEKDETPLGLMAGDQARGWGRIASQVLKCWEAKVAEFRTASRTTSEGVAVNREWRGRDLHGQTRAVVPLDAVLPHSRAALQAWVLNITDRFPEMKSALSSNGTALARLLDLPGEQMFGEIFDADAAEAIRENEMLFNGQIPGTADEVSPFPWQAHPVHISEHQRARKSREYLFAPREVRVAFDLHILAHETLEREQQMAQAGIGPAMAALPQAAAPGGSELPLPFAEQQAMGQMAPEPPSQPPVEPIPGLAA